MDNDKEKPPSRVAQEAKEAQSRAAEVKKKINELTEQIENPEKHFSKKHEQTQSSVERFRRYFSVDRGVLAKRKPTRGEMRAQRTRAIVWLCIAFFLLFVVANMVINAILH
jgi:hypothetical protein